MFGGVVRQTGTPCRPRLLAIVRPLRFAPITKAPMESFIGRRLPRRSLQSFHNLNQQKRSPDFSNHWFADLWAVLRSFSSDATAKSARSIMRANHKLHQSAEAPYGGRSDHVQSRN